MAELKLPRWIISSSCMPGGRRTSRRPVLVVPVRIEEHRNEHSIPFIPLGFVGKNTFHLDEYRFWAAAPMNEGTIVAECRCCGTVGGRDVESRRLHFGLGGCSTKLVAAYKLLLLDKVCVICNCRTTRSKWGVPLCSPACTQAWCEVEAQPKALSEALRLIGDNH